MFTPGSASRSLRWMAAAGLLAPAAPAQEIDITDIRLRDQRLDVRFLSHQDYYYVVDFWDQDGQAITNRRWLSRYGGFEGWRRQDFTPANDVPFDADKGLIVTIRRGQGTKTLALKGKVPTNDQVQVVKNDGYTLAASGFCEPVALDQSGLVESGLQGGGSYRSSDNVLLFNPGTGLFDIKLFYDSAGGVWRNADTTVTTNTLLPGQAFLILRRNRAGDFVWTNSPPYPLP
jgi:hypothetical protein